MSYAPKYIDRDDLEIIKAWIAAAKKAGFYPYTVDDGEEVVKVDSVDAAIEVIDSVEESNIRFKSDDGRSKFTLYLILNNGIGSPVSDYSAPNDEMMDVANAISAAVDPVQDRVDARRGRR